MSYVFEPSEPSIMVEIFLPRMDAYQKSLYSTLTEGFTLHKNYKSHFKSRKHEKDIKKMLNSYGIKANYTKFVDGGRKLFNGYSMYEVHGVFCSEDKKTGKSTIYEEQTTVIKIIFKPDYKDFHLKMNAASGIEVTESFLVNLSRIVLRTSYRNNEINALHYYAPIVNDPCYAIMNDKQRLACVNVVKHWVDDVGIFLFGYIVYQLTLGVNNIEEEFWVTSYWNFNVNRVVRLKSEDKKSD